MLQTWSTAGIGKNLRLDPNSEKALIPRNLKIKIRKVTPTDDEKKTLNLSKFCYNSKDSVVRNLVKEDDDFEIPVPKFPSPNEPSISKLTKPSSSKSTKFSIYESSEPSTSRAKKASENVLELSFLDLKNRINIISAKDTKVNENEKKDNDGGDSKSTVATDSNAKGYIEDKNSNRENHTEAVVNKDKGSDVVQGGGGKLDVIDDQGQFDIIDQGLTGCFLDDLDQKTIDETLRNVAAQLFKGENKVLFKGGECT
ncbi:hypothetical protein PanWU01x14_201170 [Parasponia andersonii]|uniref:Uncharacterized protein n=1 Tax=Parasponia andersonii TaxID=3476 RepID=A0A2P5BXT4_PARAD|nr:hypothetical protein PanWU01x14_201170 [Parasponia andersonii]